MEENLIRIDFPIVCTCKLQYAVNGGGSGEPKGVCLPPSDTVFVSQVLAKGDQKFLWVVAATGTRNCWHAVERTHDWELEAASSLQLVQY